LLPTRDALTIGSQLASALAQLHAARVVHCDVKPENILLAATPDHGVDARLADLGTAAITRELHGEGHLLGDSGGSGTPGYLPPEAGGLDPPTPAADIYALGVVLYELATGRGPAAVNTRPGVRLRYGDSDAASPEQLRQVEPPLTVPPQIPEVPRPLWRAVGACLRTDPSARPMAARLAEDLAVLGRNVGALLLPPDDVPPATSAMELGLPSTPVEPDELHTPVRDQRGPEVAKTVAPVVRSRWMIGLPPIVAGVLATVLVIVLGAILQRSWSSSARPSERTNTIPGEHASTRTFAERYFAPTGWICTASTAPTTAGGGSAGGGRRNSALRLCLGIWEGMVHVSVRNAGVAPTAAPDDSTVPSAGASSLGRSGPSPLPVPSVWPVKLELSSIASEPGATAETKVFRCDLFPHTGRDRCDMGPLAARAGVTYAVAAYVPPTASRIPPAASFPKTPTVLTPVIQNGRSQDHGTPSKEPTESQ
jgi:serine/threonine-protein kinase